MKLGKKPPKKDCFAYRENLLGTPNCDALNDIYCTHGNNECHFYKRKKNGDRKK